MPRTPSSHENTENRLQDEKDSAQKRVDPFLEEHPSLLGPEPSVSPVSEMGAGASGSVDVVAGVSGDGLRPTGHSTSAPSGDHGLTLKEYRVLVKTAVRKGPEMSTKAIASFEDGDIVTAFETAVNTEGVTRLRTSKGWISCKSNIVEDIGFTRPAPKNVDVVAGFAAGPEASVPAPISMSEAFLRRIEIFADVPDEALESIVGDMKALSYISGDEVVCDGNDAYDLLIVMSGEVQVTMVDTHTGDKQDLRLCPGDVFKAMVLREGSSMQRVIKPITDAKLFRLTRRRFLRHVTGPAMQLVGNESGFLMTTRGLRALFEESTEFLEEEPDSAYLQRLVAVVKSQLEIREQEDERKTSMAMEYWWQNQKFNGQAPIMHRHGTLYGSMLQTFKAVDNRDVMTLQDRERRRGLDTRVADAR